MKTDLIPIDYDYFDFEGRNYSKIIGRDNKGKRICIIDTCEVYFWAILKPGISHEKIQKLITKVKKIKLDIKGRKTRVEKVEVHEKNFLSKKVKALKIFATNYKDLHDIAERMGMPEIEKRRGYDLGFITHYIIEKNLVPLNWYEIEGEVLNNSLEFDGIDSHIDADLCIKLESLKKKDEEKFKPKVLAYDIEADEFQIGKGEILMISLVSENFKKVITWKKCPKKIDYVECVKDEAELLERFVEVVKDISPDFLTGYFSDGFDLPYLRARAQENRVKLSLGLDESQPRFSRAGTGKGLGTGKINGIVHIDLLRFIQTAYSQYMQSETMSLNEVAGEFLGDSKKDFEFKHSSKIEDWEKYFEYNLHDSVLTYNLFEKFWPDMLEFTRVMQEPIFDVSRNGMSRNVEDYIIHNLKKFDEIPEKRPAHDEISERKRREKYEGAFVFQPSAGIYENVGIFDFTSYWPSIIVTFNLSRSTLLEKKEKDSLEVEIKGEKIFFSKKPGFFSEMLKEIIEKRKQYKKELNKKFDVIKKARSNAFKLLANASYGYQGFFGARYHCAEASAATTAISRDFIQNIIKKIDEKGYRTIYSDTDSIAFLLNKNTKAQAKQFLIELNKELPGVMELELEDFYKRGIWVTRRSGDIGAKKKYALINDEGKLKIRGFETVRRDWCRLARETQNKIIKLILETGNEKGALEYVKEVIEKIKKREAKLKELLIRTQLKKPITEYKALTPHVIAAKRMIERDMPIDMGGLIEYYIAEPSPGSKSKLVRDRVKLPDEKGEYEIKYYLEKQILPAVENIFQIFGVDAKEMVESKKQDKLNQWMK